MGNTTEQNRRYRLKYPEKIREGKRKYLARKLEKKLRENPEFLEDWKKRFLSEFGTLTRLSFDNILPRECFLCGSTRDLEIHHIRYIYPIQEKDIRRLCKRCHQLEYQRVAPLLI